MKRNDERLRWLLDNFNYIDSVTMIDNTGKIVCKARYNPRFSEAENAIDNEWCLGKHLLEAFPSLNHNNSSLLQALSSGDLIYSEEQVTLNHSGRKSVTNNITFPIISRGKIVGALEISRDVTHVEASSVSHSAPPPRPEPVRSTSSARWTLDDIVTQHPSMQELKTTIQKIADSRSSVLVYGETGTGKELVVSAIHNAGSREGKPFIAVNCAALPESILEGLLFGSQRGAFTGAENKKGLFAEANGGTIYLDEINSMPILLQAKLLRVLQEKTVTPLGSSKPIPIDVRIIASVNRPVHELISSGQMRADILYRLNTINLHIPPLRERLTDIPILARYFLDKYNREMNKHVAGLSPEVLDFLMERPWHGNVRELEHVIESAVNITENGETIQLGKLPIYLFEAEEPSEVIQEKYDMLSPSLTESMDAYERRLILDAMRASNWKIVDAAKRLKIPRTSLQYKLDKHGIKRR